MAVGEHLGYLFTGAWTGLVGIAAIQSEAVHPAFGIVGVALSPLFLIGSLEFVGSHEAEGWNFAGVLVPIAYVAWSLWLLALGTAFLL